MKRYQKIISAGIIFLSSLSAHAGVIVSDFDSIKPIPFEYRDELGSSIKSEIVSKGQGRGKVMAISYEIADMGWAGWGIPLKNFNASGFEFISFYIRGEEGGESFEIGLKDRDGKEKRILSANYFDVTASWQNVKIPLSSFDTVNLQKLENITFAFSAKNGGGTINVDDIGFEGEAASTTQGGESGAVTRSNSILVDGFERANPFDFYVVRKGDDSTLTLSSSRILHDGDYSMELEYFLSTKKSWGSWVLAYRDAGATPLDWSGVESLKLWIRGDGSDMTLRLAIIDGDGKTWAYDDLNTLKSTRWERITAPIAEFRTITQYGEAPATLNLKKVKAYAIGILSKTNGDFSGKIYVDQLTAQGEGLSAVWAAPSGAVEKLRAAIPRVGNIDFNGTIFSEFFWCPEESRKFFHWGKLSANGMIGNFSGRLEYAAFQDMDDSTRQVFTSDGLKRVILEDKFPPVEAVSIQMMANNIGPSLTNLTIGNVWFNYSKYTFALPVLGPLNQLVPAGWGYKGVTAEGDIGRFNYHAFYIAQPYDSYVAGTRWINYWPSWKIVAYGVYDYESAKHENAGQVNSDGTLSNSNDWDIKPVSDDTVYNLEVWHWLFDKKIQIQLNTGWNHFNRYATTNSTDIFHPIYNQELTPHETLCDPLYRGQIETNNLLFDDLQLFYEYRYIGTEYKPAFRQEPSWFDDSYADQQGYNVRLVKKFRGFVLSGEYDDIIRLRNDDFFRYRTTYGIGYYGFDGMDIALTYERKREKYDMSSTRSLFTTSDYGFKDWLNNIGELYVRNQLTQNLAVWFKIRHEEIDVLNVPKKDATSSLFTKLEYYISSNAKFFAEYKTTTQPIWEPKGYPFDDNYLLTSFELTF